MHTMEQNSKDKKLDYFANNLFLFISLFHRKMQQLEKSKTGVHRVNMQLRVLFMLNEVGTSQPSEIGRKMAICRPNVTSIVNGLIIKGYVVRQYNDKDHRIVNIAISEKGRRFVAINKRKIANNIKEILYSLHEKDVDILNSALDNLRNVISRIEYEI
jgi:DNA-binding MarR family transcriptional regulator